jgi:hypothetical protein
MFFSKVVLFAIALGTISVLASPHAPYHRALHHRALAARVTLTSSNPLDGTVKRQDGATNQQIIQATEAKLFKRSSISPPFYHNQKFQFIHSITAGSKVACGSTTKTTDSVVSIPHDRFNECVFFKKTRLLLFFFPLLA